MGIRQGIRGWVRRLFYRSEAVRAAVAMVSELVRGALRISDQVARFSTEGFVVLMCETKDDMARPVGDRVCSLVAARGIPLTDTASVTVSVGVSEAEATDKSAQQIVQRASDACRKAAAGGGNTCVLVRGS